MRTPLGVVKNVPNIKIDIKMSPFIFENTLILILLKQESRYFHVMLMYFLEQSVTDLHKSQSTVSRHRKMEIEIWDVCDY